MNTYERVFITGADGFIGRALSERLRADGVEVAGVDTRPSSQEVVVGDISRDGAWLESVDGADLVIHTAVIVSMQGDPDSFYDINIAGTRRVLEAAVRTGAKRFVQFSSTVVYSDRFPPNVDETYPVRINGNPYVDTKIASEQVVFQAHSAGEIPVSVVRPGDVYGPGSRPWTTEPVEMLKRHQFMLPGKGEGIFSPIYIDDLIDGALAVAESPNAAGHAFNISCAAGVTNKEFFGHYARMLGVSLPCLPVAVLLPLAATSYRLRRVLPVSPDTNPNSLRFLLRKNSHSIAKARELLGWEPRVGLEEGMRRTEAWLRTQGMLDRR